jgi:hypothetical protein
MIDYQIISSNATARATAWATTELWGQSATSREVWGDTILRAAIEAGGAAVPPSFRVTGATEPSRVAVWPTPVPTHVPTFAPDGEIAAAPTAPADDASGLQDLKFELIVAACCAIMMAIAGYVQRKLLRRMCSANKMNSRDSLAAGQRELDLHIGDAVLKQRDVQKHDGIEEVERRLQAEPATQLVWVVRGFVTGNTDGSIEKDPSAWFIKIEGPFTAEGAARKTLECSKSLRLQKSRSSSDVEESIARRRVSKYLQASKSQTDLQQRNLKSSVDSSYKAGQLKKVPIGFGLAVEQQHTNPMQGPGAGALPTGVRTDAAVLHSNPMQASASSPTGKAVTGRRGAAEV